jgi:hypothetical protein
MKPEKSGKNIYNVAYAQGKRKFFYTVRYTQRLRDQTKSISGLKKDLHSLLVN